MQIDRFLYQEVFVVGVDHVTSIAGELKICESFEDMVEYLRSKTVGISLDLRVLHGVLTSAKAIPNDFCGRQAYILLTDPEGDGYGSFLDSTADDSCEELAEEIEKLLSSEEIAVSFLEIDDVYVLYGYELNIILSVDEDEIDEELIAQCLKAGEKAKELDKSRED
jgi:hypothetical protein